MVALRSGSVQYVCMMMVVGDLSEHHDMMVSLTVRVAALISWAATIASVGNKL